MPVLESPTIPKRFQKNYIFTLLFNQITKPSLFPEHPKLQFFSILDRVDPCFFSATCLSTYCRLGIIKKQKKAGFSFFFNTWILAGTGRLHDFRTFARFHPDGRWLMAMPASPPPILPSCSRSQSEWPTEGTIPHCSCLPAGKQGNPGAADIDDGALFHL